MIPGISGTSGSTSGSSGTAVQLVPAVPLVLRMPLEVYWLVPAVPLVSARLLAPTPSLVLASPLIYMSY